MDGLKLTLFYLGHLGCQYFRIVKCDDESRMYQSPVSAILIQHPTLGNILYDTGNSPYSKREYGSHINEVYPVNEFISIEDALASKGLTCGDIDMLIFSHLHFDHAGGLRYFVGTKAVKNAIVAEAELLNACKSVFTGEKHGAYPLPKDKDLRAGEVQQIVQYLQKEGRTGADQLSLAVAGMRAAFSDNAAVQKLASALMAELAQYQEPGRDDVRRQKPLREKSQER